MSHIEALRTDHLLEIRLNRPENQNRFTQSMLAKMGALLREADEDHAIRAILLTGAGADFCAGGDIADILPAWKQGINPLAPNDINPTGISTRRLTKPLLSVVQGQCHSGGMEFAIASDICVAADTARFAFQEIRLGAFPFAGGVFRFIRAAGMSNAMRYVLTGDEFDAQEAYRMNVVTAVKPAADAQEYARDLATRISRMAPLAVKAIIKQTRAWCDVTDASLLQRCVGEEVQLLNTKDCAEALTAIAQKRAPHFVGG